MNQVKTIIHIEGKANQVFQRIKNLCRWNGGQITLGEIAKQEELRALAFKDNNYWVVN
jgi:hypothetical protein